MADQRCPEITGFFDSTTSSITYVVADPVMRRCAVIDPVLDYDPRSGRTTTAGADAVAAFVRDRGFVCDWILETHVHADHMTGARHLRATLGGRTGIGRHVDRVQRTFAAIYNLDIDFADDETWFDHLFDDGDSFSVGGIAGRVLLTPGHTPACVAYRIGESVFVGDTMLMPDFGTARCDFPGGDARLLYRSARRLLALPPSMRMFVAHDYGPNGRAIAWQTSVAAQREGNLHLRDGISEDEFVALRTRRDATLELPALMLAAIQVNIRGGRLPEAEANGTRYLKIPLNRF